MTATETLAAAVEPHTGPIAYGPQTMARLAYNRLKYLGWQFEIAARTNAVMVLKPRGGKWHVTGDSFCWACGSRLAVCLHRQAVAVCGGVEMLRGFISEDSDV